MLFFWVALVFCRVCGLSRCSSRKLCALLRVTYLMVYDRGEDVCVEMHVSFMCVFREEGCKGSEDGSEDYLY